MSPEAALVVEMGAQRQAFHSLVRVRCTPMSRDGSADAASVISRNHGPGTITEPQVTSPRAARSRKALFAPWLAPRSSTWGTTARLNGPPSTRSIKVIARSRRPSFLEPFPTKTEGRRPVHLSTAEARPSGRTGLGPAATASLLQDQGPSGSCGLGFRGAGQ